MRVAQWTYVGINFISFHVNSFIGFIKAGGFLAFVYKISYQVSNLRIKGWMSETPLYELKVFTKALVTGIGSAVVSLYIDMSSRPEPEKMAQAVEYSKQVKAFNTGTGLIVSSSFLLVLITITSWMTILSYLGCDVWWLWNATSVPYLQPETIDLRCDAEAWSICISQNIYPDIDLAAAEIQLQDCMKHCREVFMESKKHPIKFTSPKI